MLKTCLSQKDEVFGRKTKITFVLTSVFQPGFHDWLPGVSPKQTEIATSTHLVYYWNDWHLLHCIGFHEQRKYLREVPLQQKGWKTLGLTLTSSTNFCVWRAVFSNGFVKAYAAGCSRKNITARIRYRNIKAISLFPHFLRLIVCRTARYHSLHKPWTTYVSDWCFL